MIVKMLATPSLNGELGSVGPVSVTARITFLRITSSESARKMPLFSLLPILPVPSRPGIFTRSAPKL